MTWSEIAYEYLRDYHKYLKGCREEQYQEKIADALCRIANHVDGSSPQGQ